MEFKKRQNWESDAIRDLSKNSLFEKLSNNFKLVRPYFQWKKDLSNYGPAIICPICMNFLESEYLTKQNDPKEITMDHIPPYALGGTDKILVCKKCNNTAGFRLDAKLLEFLNVINPFNRGEPDAGIKGKISLQSPSKPTLNASVILKRNDKQFQINLLDLNDYRNNVLDSYEGTKDYTIQFQSQKIPTKTVVYSAYLRIAYLLAFRKFGHSFILSGYSKVREQILNPDKQILPSLGFIESQATPRAAGVYFVTQPVDLKGILVVFYLKKGDKWIHCSVMLPPAEGDEIKFYHQFQTYQNNKILFEVQELRPISFIDRTEQHFLFAPQIAARQEYKFDLTMLGWYHANHTVYHEGVL